MMLGINYWPEETGIAVFNTGRCEYLAAQGHDVTMCTGFPYYPRWRVDDATAAGCSGGTLGTASGSCARGCTCRGG